MSDSSRKDATDPLHKLPKDWRLFLVDSKMKVLASKGPTLAGGSTSVVGLDLADALEMEGLELADVGELLVCLEDMPSDCELRLRLGDPATCIVARGFEESSRVCCLVLRPKADLESEAVLPDAWLWASQSAKSLGLAGADTSCSPLRLMVVDRNPEVVELVKALARKVGCRSEGALSAGEALAQAKSRQFDLVLVDREISGFGLSLFQDLLDKRGLQDWGVAPLVAVMAASTRGIEENDMPLLEKPVSIEDLKELAKAAREHRSNVESDRSPSLGLPVLNLGLWQSDLPLLRRLSQALVAQGADLTAKLRDKPGYAVSDELGVDLKSLKNGSDIVHAYRLSESCRSLLDSVHRSQSSVWKSRLDDLMIEIEGFRLFADAQGLLRD